MVSYKSVSYSFIPCKLPILNDKIQKAVDAIEQRYSGEYEIISFNMVSAKQFGQHGFDLYFLLKELPEETKEVINSENPCYFCDLDPEMNNHQHASVLEMLQTVDTE